jgi:hypothetical protein
MRFPLRALAPLLTLALATPSAALAQASVPPPSLVAPLVTAAAPVLFQWTPVAPAVAYRLHVQGQRRTIGASTVTPIVAVSYEVQIGDRPDVGSHVLYDRVVDTTSFLFDNRNVDGSGFTELQPPGLPLSGGTYYWRVRALFGGPGSAFSSIGRFMLAGGGATSTPLHDLGVTSVVVAASPIAGVGTAVVARVGNLGTFPERDAWLAISANGRTIGRAPVPQLLPGDHVDVSVVWAPQGGGLAQLTAQLEYVDQNSVDDQATQTTFVATRKPVPTTLVGTLVAEQSGGFAIADATGRIVASVRAAEGSHVAFAPLVGKRVAVAGTLAALGTGLVFDAHTITGSAR